MKSISFEELNLSFIKDAVDHHFIILKDGMDFHIKIFLRDNSEKLVVFSNGAIDPSKKEPPIFMRESWASDLKHNTVFIDDRTVHNSDLKIGWGVGTKDRHYLKDYSEIIKKLTELMNLQNKNVYYYGSSAGGFMSMGLAAMHADTIAIVNNPQTYVFNYFKAYVNELYETVFFDVEKTEISKRYSNRLSITNLFRYYKRVPKIFYFQNRKCISDMKNQYLPFVNNLDRYKFNSNNINFILYTDYINGHNPLNKKMTLEIINRVVNEEFLIIK